MSQSPKPNDQAPPARSEPPILAPLDQVSESLTEAEENAISGMERRPDELPGRASSTTEDLTSLFANPSSEHIADGFAGSGDEDGSRDEHLSQNDGDLPNE